MNYIIGDIGNTNIKICKLNKDFKIINTYFFQTKKNSLEKDLKIQFNKIINDNTNRKILFSSVVPNIYAKVVKILKKDKLKVYEIKKLDLKKILKFKVKKYSKTL